MGPTPALFTLGISGMPPSEVVEAARQVEADIALDIRPKNKAASAKAVGRLLRWKAGIPESRHVPELASWSDDQRQLDRLVSTLRRKGRVLIVCSCPEPWRCERRRLAIRAYLYFDRDLEVRNLGFEDAKPPKVPKDAAPSCEAKYPPKDDPDRIAKDTSLVNRIEAGRALVESQRKLREVVAGMGKSERYTIEAHKIADERTARRRTVTGYFSGSTRDAIHLEDRKGRMQKVPIRDVTRITLHTAGSCRCDWCQEEPATVPAAAAA